MAINYTDLFTNIGVLVKATNTLANFTTTVKTQRDTVMNQLSGNQKYGATDQLLSTWNSYVSSILGWTGDSTNRIFNLLQDKTSVVDQLSLGNNSSFATVFPALYADMVTNDKNVTANSVTIGSVTATTANANTGTVLVDKILDGVTPPGTTYSPYRCYNGVTSQLSITDTVILKCVQDSESLGTTVGNEIFNWIGAYPDSIPSRAGSSNGPAIQPLGVQTYLSNLLFDSFSSNAPNSFTVNAGTAGTHIFEDASGQYEGSSCLKLTGDAAQSSINISQALTTSQLIPLKRYVFICHVKGQTGTSSGTFTIQLEGTGYTAGASEKIELNAATLAGLTSWTRYSFYVNMPLEIPDDMKLVIKWTGTPSAHSVRVDNGAFGLPTWFNGVNVAIHKGSGKFLYGDTLKFTLTNNGAGTFQTHARDYLGIQWPTDATPTISDTLAQ